jgi:hypothetical protein
MVELPFQRLSTHSALLFYNPVAEVVGSKQTVLAEVPAMAHALGKQKQSRLLAGTRESACSTTIERAGSWL